MTRVTHRTPLYVTAVALLAIMALARGGSEAPPSDNSAASVVRSDGRVYLARDGKLDVLDARSGAILQELPIAIGLQSYFMAVDPVGKRLIVNESTADASGARPYLTIYRTTDWSIERTVETPTIIQYLGEQPGIAVSTDGKYLFVYNYDGPTNSSDPGPVRYWLTTFDLVSGQWVGPDVDLPGCGASQLLPAGGRRLYVLCYDSDDVRVVNTGAFIVDARLPVNVAGQLADGTSGLRAASAAAFGDNLYVVRENRGIRAITAGPDQSAVRDLTGSAGTGNIVPFKPVAVDATGSELYVSTGSVEDRSLGFSTEIAVIDLKSGAVARTVKPSGRFGPIAFAPDASAAFVGFVKPDGTVSGLARIDLTTGAEDMLFDNTMSWRVIAN